MENNKNLNNEKKEFLSEEKILGEAAQSDGASERHSHHHSHHSHHSHHLSKKEQKREKARKKRRENAKKIKQFIRKNLAQFIAIFLLAATLCVLMIIALRPQKTAEKESAPVTNGTIVMGEKLQLTIPFFTKEISLVPQAVNAYLESDLSASVADVLAPYRKDGARLDRGLSVELEFGVTGIPSGYSISEVKVEVDEDASFSAPRVFRLSGEKRSLSVPYLKTKTEYFYRITLIFANKKTTAAIGSFLTADTPRLLSIDGLVNVRDIGNRKTLSGKTVRQGMLIRGSELDGAVEESYNVTTGGLLDALTVLGIRTDMDLRSSTDHTDHTDALGANVTHKYYGVAMYDGIFADGEGEKIRAVFSDLAKPENYPVYLHCTYGADRTGTVCYLLGALLGLSEDDLEREYELTALYYEGVDAKELIPLREKLNEFEGQSFSEKCENYLLSIGVTEAEIASIREILLED